MKPFHKWFVCRGFWQLLSFDTEEDARQWAINKKIHDKVKATHFFCPNYYVVYGRISSVMARQV